VIAVSDYEIMIGAKVGMAGKASTAYPCVFAGEYSPHPIELKALTFAVIKSPYTRSNGALST